jgi:hypothetical protein
MAWARNAIDQKKLQAHGQLNVSGPPDSSGRQNLDLILPKLGVEIIRRTIVEYGVTDLWLPLSKQMFRRVSVDPNHVGSFLELQAAHVHWGPLGWIKSDSDGRSPTLLRQHYSLEDDEDIVVENRLLGEGAVGVVEEVTVSLVSLDRWPIVCVRKKIARPKQLKAHQQIMNAFTRELDVMR